MLPFYAFFIKSRKVRGVHLMTFNTVAEIRFKHFRMDNLIKGFPKCKIQIIKQAKIALFDFVSAGSPEGDPAPRAFHGPKL